MRARAGRPEWVDPPPSTQGMPEYDALCDKHCRITKTRTFSRHLRKQRAVEAKVAGSNAERAAVSRTKAQTQTQAQAQGLVPSRVPSRYMASATYPFACVSGRQSDSVLVVRRSVGETAEADDVLHTRPEPTRGPFLGPLAALNEIGVDTRPLSRAASRLAQSTTVLDIRRELTLERSQKRQLERAAAAEEEQAREERARRHAEAKSRREDAQRQQLPRSWSGSLPSPTAVHARRRDDAESLRRALAQQQAEEERRAEAAARVAESYAEQRAMRQAVLEARRSATAWRGRATRPTTSLLQRSAACQRPAATVGGGPLPESPSRRIFPQLRRVDSRRALAKSMGVSVQLVEAATQGIGGGSQGSQLPSPSVGDDGATASTSGAAAPARVSPPGEGEGVAPPLAPEPAEEATSAERGEEGDSSSVALAD